MSYTRKFLTSNSVKPILLFHTISQVSFSKSTIQKVLYSKHYTEVSVFGVDVWYYEINSISHNNPYNHGYNMIDVHNNTYSLKMCYTVL